MDIYVSWVKGLPQDEEALAILRNSGIIAGIEMSNVDQQVEMVLNAGLKFSAHTPGLNLTLNLAKPNFFEVFNVKYPSEKPEGARLFEVIQKSSAPVGFHLGYSATSVFKMMAFPNVPSSETIITDYQKLSDIISGNLATLAMFFGSLDPPKKILIETLDWSRKGKQPSWDKQLEEVKENRDKIQTVIDQYGPNAGLLFVTGADFIDLIFRKTDVPTYFYANNHPIAFIFDIAHNFISADAKSHDLSSDSIENYFQKMLDVVRKRTYQLHLTVPEGNDEIGYADHHHPFTPGDSLSDKIMDLSKKVFSQTPNVELITLEMKTGLPPIQHAKAMVKQAEYVIKQLNL